MLLVHIHACDMERLEALLLQLVMLDLCAARGDDLGEGVGGIGQTIGTHVVLDDCNPAPFVRNHDVARVRYQSGLGGKEQQVYRLFERGTCTQTDKAPSAMNAACNAAKPDE